MSEIHKDFCNLFSFQRALFVIEEVYGKLSLGSLKENMEYWGQVRIINIFRATGDSYSGTHILTKNNNKRLEIVYHVFYSYILLVLFKVIKKDLFGFGCPIQLL